MEGAGVHNSKMQILCIGGRRNFQVPLEQPDPSAPSRHMRSLILADAYLTDLGPTTLRA